MSRENTILAAFQSSADAQSAATELQQAGIPRDDIYLETKSNQSSEVKHESAEGGFTGWVKSLFSENDRVERSSYESAIQRGTSLLRVDVLDEEIPAIEEILNRHSPVDVHAESGTAATKSSGGGSAIPVVKEEIQVGKRGVLRGGVRVYSRLVERPVEESIRLREEHVRVDRQAVNRAATSSDLSSAREQVTEVQEFAEEPVIAKQARVVEEIRVGKDVSERTENIGGTVRNTEVKVEQIPGSRKGVSDTVPVTSDDSDFRSDYQQRYAAAGGAYDTYLPAYQYGHTMASDPRYQGRSFEESEADLRADYGRRYPTGTWERMKDAVRFGWERVTGKAVGASR
jgi:stress response protein YsnF